KFPLHATRVTENAPGRSRWMPDGRSVAYTDQDEKGTYGVFVQDFDPEKADTSASRRKLGGFGRDFETESLAISPDGKKLVVASLERFFGISTLEGVPGIEGRGAR